MKKSLSQPLSLPFSLSLLAGLALLGTAPLTALADSSAASSASTSITTSLGSSSNSIQRSSDSSSQDKKVAQGDYRVLALTEPADQPGMVRVQLQALAGQGGHKGDEFFLLLPRQAALNGQLAEGKLVAALQRPYGMEFAAADAQGQRQAFFLVLDDDWHRELQSHPVLL